MILIDEIIGITGPFGTLILEKDDDEKSFFVYIDGGG